jgi:hypothetical protein
MPELTLTILPLEARSNGRKRCETASTPTILASSWVRITSIGAHFSGALTQTPALFTTAHSPVSVHRRSTTSPA